MHCKREIHKPDGEYYTSYETAKLFLKPILPLLKDKKVICPMNNKDSYIYERKYFYLFISIIF